MDTQNLQLCDSEFPLKNTPNYTSENPTIKQVGEVDTQC